MHFPSIIEYSLLTDQAVKTVLLRLFFDEKLVFFKGHFDNAHILPGIAQTHFVIEYAAQFLAIDKTQITNIPQLKFSKVILPNTVINLRIEQHAHRLVFNYTDDQKNLYSSGKISL